MQNDKILHPAILPIHNGELLSAEEEISLVILAKNGDELSMHQLIVANHRFVCALAKRYQGNGLFLEELINAGNKGIAEACMKFNPAHGFKFISYAVWFVRHAILNELNLTK